MSTTKDEKAVMGSGRKEVIIAGKIQIASRCRGIWFVEEFAVGLPHHRKCNTYYICRSTSQIIGIISKS
jgi:hypothetical protein